MVKLRDIFNPFRALKYLIRPKPFTCRYPYEQHVDIEGETVPYKDYDGPESMGYRGIHINDWETCIGCGNCSRICPTTAIEMVPVEGFVPPPTKKGKPGKDLRPKVDYGRCCFCAFCSDVCPDVSLKLTKKYSYIQRTPDKFIFLPTMDLLEEDNGYKVTEEYLLFSEKDYLEFRKRHPNKVEMERNESGGEDVSSDE